MAQYHVTAGELRALEKLLDFYGVVLGGEDAGSSPAVDLVAQLSALLMSLKRKTQVHPNAVHALGVLLDAYRDLLARLDVPRASRPELANLESLRIKLNQPSDAQTRLA